jgi:hypothetical protein
VRHEIAHALTDSQCGHADMLSGRWTARCGSCGAAFDRHRKPVRRAGWFCRQCGPAKGRLNWATVTETPPVSTRKPAVSSLTT